MPQAPRTRSSGTIHLLSKETKLQIETRLFIVLIDVVLENHPMQRASSLAFTDPDTFRLYPNPPARRQQEATCICRKRAKGKLWSL